MAAIPVAPIAAAAPPAAPSPLPSAPPVIDELSAPESPPSEDSAAPVVPTPRVVLADELPYRFHRPPTDEGAEGPRAPPRRRHRSSRPYHPGPGIVVDVAAAEGGVAASDLQRVMRSSGYWPFRRCYEEGLRRDQRLTGHVTVDLANSVRGSVERATVASSSLRDESVALCIGRETAHLALPSGPAPTHARLEVTLSTGDEPVPVPRPVQNADALRDALRASWPAVEQCYAAELARRPDAGGRLELRFRAKSTGDILEVAESGDTRFADVDITRCVLGVYRTTRLPAGRICSPRDTSFFYAMHLEAKP